jgi:hypothetical protein
LTIGDLIDAVLTLESNQPVRVKRNFQVIEGRLFIPATEARLCRVCRDGVSNERSRVRARSKHRRGMNMNHYVGIDVSLEASNVCVVDANGKIVRQGKVTSEPDALIAWLKGLKLKLTRIGLEAGPLSQWL